MTNHHVPLEINDNWMQIYSNVYENLHLQKCLYEEISSVD